MMSVLSISHQIVLDRAIDTPVHVKYIVGGFNSFQKRYLANCLIIRSTPEVEKTDSKRMRVDAMTKMVEVSFDG